MYHFDIEDYLLVVHSIRLGCGIYYAQHTFQDWGSLTQNQRSIVEMPTKKRTTRKGTAGRSNTDAIALLKNDHKNVKQLLKRLESTTDRNSAQRAQLLEEIENELKVHTTIEEQIFYPAFKESIRAKLDAHLYYEALEEHHLVDLVMPEIKDAEADSEEFAAKAKVLKDLMALVNKVVFEG